jgi:hypothetical protein
MPEQQPIWDLLKRDHEALAAHLDHLRSVDEALARALLRRFVCELTAYARAKESVFYGHLLHDERARTQVLEGLEDHKRIDAAFADLELLPHGDEKWSARLAEVGDRVRARFRVEEAELFALARQALSEVQALELAGQFAGERARIKGDLSCFDAPR